MQEHFYSYMLILLRFRLKIIGLNLFVFKYTKHHWSI